MKVVGTGQEDHYLNVVIASVRYYNLSLLRLPPGNYAVQVSTNDGNVISFMSSCNLLNNRFRPYHQMEQLLGNIPNLLHILLKVQ